MLPAPSEARAEAAASAESAEAVAPGPSAPPAGTRIAEEEEEEGGENGTAAGAAANAGSESSSAPSSASSLPPPPLCSTTPAAGGKEDDRCCDACPHCADVCDDPACEGCRAKRERLRPPPQNDDGGYDKQVPFVRRLLLLGSLLRGGDDRRSTRREYTRCQVRRHAHERSAWIVSKLHGDDFWVYDVTSRLSVHPGGTRSILRRAGGVADCTRDLGYHSRGARRLWRSLEVGRLVRCPGEEEEESTVDGCCGDRRGGGKEGCCFGPAFLGDVCDALLLRRWRGNSHGNNIM